MYKRWRVYSTFLTGILIGLFYAVLVGGRLFTDLETSELSVEGQVLILSFSGILGGVVYTIMLDGHVEMPRFIGGRGNQFKAGLFGDILLGIAGAFILEALLPSELLTSPVGSGEPDLRNTAIAATGIIGGYGGRAILQFALNRFFKQSGTLSVPTSQPLPSIDEEVEELQPDAVDQALGLTDQIDAYIRDGVSDNELARLQSLLNDTDAQIQQRVFEDLVELRSPEMGLQLTSAQLQRMIPLFEVLIEGAPKDHRYAGELALIYRDLEQPDYSKTLRYLDQAIALRGSLTMGQPWEYELNRAIARIQQGYQATQGYEFVSHLQEAIIDDLLAITRIYNLKAILQSVKIQQIHSPILGWMNQNKLGLASRQDTQALLHTLQAALTEKRQGSDNTSEPSSPQIPGSTDEIVSVPPVAIIAPDISIPDNPKGLVLPTIYDFLGRCYDILYLDPFNISENAKITRIFDFYPGEAEEIEVEEKISLEPKGVHYTDVSKGNLNFDINTEILYTESDIQKLFSSQMGGLVSHLVGHFLPFSLSSSYKRIQKERKKERSVYAFNTAEYMDYILDLILDLPKNLHINQQFQEAVAHLPVTADKHKYQKFIKKFGTHFSVQVKFGGLAYHRIRLNESTYTAVVKKGGDLEVEAKKIINAGISKSTQSSTYREIQEHSEEFKFCGGDPNKDLFEWISTVKKDPAPIKMELKALNELLTPKFFPRDSFIQERQRLLKDAIRAYLEGKSEEPPWEPWSSVAIGGHGGEAFTDIKLTPNELEFNKMRYQKARVTEIKVWIGSWVDGIQMVLDGDSLPFSIHGREKGDPQTFKVKPGDYITGVSVTTVTSKTLVVTGGPYIASLEIHTLRGDKWTAGNSRDQSIALDIPKENYQVIGFHGRSGKYVDKLGVISIPIVNKLTSGE